MQLYVGIVLGALHVYSRESTSNQIQLIPTDIHARTGISIVSLCVYIHTLYYYCICYCVLSIHYAYSSLRTTRSALILSLLLLILLTFGAYFLLQCMAIAAVAMMMAPIDLASRSHKQVGVAAWLECWLSPLGVAGSSPGRDNCESHWGNKRPL